MKTVFVIKDSKSDFPLSVCWDEGTAKETVGTLNSIDSSHQYNYTEVPIHFEASIAQSNMLAAVLSPRKFPCLCACCPTCGAVFMTTALKEEYHNDYDNMKELLDDITDYARQGYTIVSKDASEFRLNYCEHLKAAKA